jgi:hypothetical protein
MITSRATKPTPRATPTAVAIVLAVLKESPDKAIAAPKDFTDTVLRRLRGVLRSVCRGVGAVEARDLLLAMPCMRDEVDDPAMPSMVRESRSVPGRSLPINSCTKSKSAALPGVDCGQIGKCGWSSRWLKACNFFGESIVQQLDTDTPSMTFAAALQHRCSTPALRQAKLTSTTAKPPHQKSQLLPRKL